MKRFDGICKINLRLHLLALISYNHVTYKHSISQTLIIIEILTRASWTTFASLNAQEDIAPVRVRENMKVRKIERERERAENAAATRCNYNSR